MTLPQRDITGQNLCELTMGVDGVVIYDRDNDEAWIEADPAATLEGWR